ncbi:CHRD domain-containing protein [Euzebya rosea]|uniref:CHRD domain-containing protein n=1 Tax=Euzebya rosea TaxID=2052804 RepID=UPI000D3EDC6F|nr:CHRD domain-containing protein [Euzebya rosea]
MTLAARVLLVGSLLLGGLVAVPAAAQEPAAEVDVVNVDYEPADVTIELGEVVRWTFVEGTHTVTADDERFDSGTQTSNTTYDVTFNAVGTFEYYCAIHSSPDGDRQNGTVTVVEQGEGPGDPEPTEPPSSEPPIDGPLDGTDPIATSLAWSARLPDGGATTAFVGTAGGFADSLASGTGQGLLDAPLLLTPRDTLDPRVADELRRLGTTRVIVLGLEAAIGAEVEQALADVVDTVDRVGGPSRLETARAVADLLLGDTIPEVLLARAFGEGSAAFADSLGAGALGAVQGTPVLLVGDTVDDGLRTWLADHGVQRITIVGGTAAVPAAVEEDLSSAHTVVRAAGPTRTATAASFIGAFPDAAGVVVVEGFGDTAWASGFAAALHAHGGLVLADGGRPALPGDTVEVLFRRGPVVCGPTLAADLCGQAVAAHGRQDLQNPLMAVMDVGQEVATDPATPAASGVARMWRSDAGEDALCVDAEVWDLSGPIVAAHVHVAPPGEPGPVAVPVHLEPVAGQDGRVVGCSRGGAEQAQAVAALVADPAAHYLNVHTDLNPAGEIRGQVFLPGTSRVAALSGANEVPGPGHPDATGAFTLHDTGVADELCWSISWEGLDSPVTGAHIHAGTSTESGGVVHALNLGPGSRSAGCDREVDPSVRTAILADPGGHYVNVHTEDFPDGAIRGQLT